MLPAAAALRSSRGPAEPAGAPAQRAASADACAPSYPVSDATAPFWSVWMVRLCGDERRTAVEREL